MCELNQEQIKSDEYKLGSSMGFKDHWTQNEYTACPAEFNEEQKMLFREGFISGRRCEMMTGAL